MVFAGVNTGIHTCALADPLDEGNRLIRSHTSARIMTVLFKIEDQQHTRLVHERYPTCESAGSPAPEEETHAGEHTEGGLLEHLVRKVLE